MLQEKPDFVRKGPARVEALEARQFLSVTSATITLQSTPVEGQPVAFSLNWTTDHDWMEQNGHAPTHWSINYGDGHTDDFIADTPQNIYHVFNEESASGSGNYTVQAYVWDDAETTYGYTSSTFGTQTTANVQDAPISVVANTFGYTQNEEDMYLVGSFTDANPNPEPGDFSATIDWGDGTTGEGSVYANDNGGFDVYGIHTYTGTNDYTTNVSVIDIGGSSDAQAGIATLRSGAHIVTAPSRFLIDLNAPSPPGADEDAVEADASGRSVVTTITVANVMRMGTRASSNLLTITARREDPNSVLNIVNINWKTGTGGVQPGDRFLIKLVATDGAVGYFEADFST